MKRPARIAIPLALVSSAAAAAVALGAAIPIYSNDMSTTGARGQLVRVGQGKCDRGGGGHALKVTVGEATKECQLRTPVVGRNLDITTTARLLQGTPAEIQAGTFIAVGLRAGDGGQYQLAVFPKKGSYQLRRDTPSGEESGAARTLLAKGPAGAIKDVGKANKLRLQTFAGAGGDVRVTAFVNGKKLSSLVEPASTAAALSGNLSTVSVGSEKAATGATGSFDDLKVAVPDPF